ncbi:EcsC family protein [Rhodopirellula halodulae]|uniref:EcsC family protein n=1 Tax=Rhodopirellula halodulae TaxID=2894198 RepID=UPI001E43D064|nr:EcsC family protein [Rhodopirellula sp. JC737]MCC9655030.1 EcsC family protein [Rhodopirellula sp. JC737]
MNENLLTDELPADALEELRIAKKTLEHHGIADRLTEMIGAPITASLRMLPDGVESAVHAAIDKSLHVALDVALKTLGEGEGSGGKLGKPKLLSHKVLAGLSGAAGGALGGATVVAELPVSTVLILRSVADIARSEGEDLAQVETRLACLEVFALDPGNDAEIDDETEIGYFAVRAAMAKQIKDASTYILKHGVRDQAAPPLVRLVAQIGKRFGVVVSEKLAAQAIPVIGAVGGALINSYFIDHYQDLARAHFTIRRLERQHGEALIREAYSNLEVK